MSETIQQDIAPAVQRRTGAAAVAAGVLFFLGQGGELVFGDDSKPLLVLLVCFLAVAIVAFGVAFWGLRALLHTSRAGRVGGMLGVVGSALLVAFSVQLMVSAARTGEVPENFILFALGFLMILFAHLVLAFPLRGLVGGAWFLSPLAAVALAVGLFVNEDYIWHDVALFAFEACWVALGVVLLRLPAALSP
jgi:hypothetical protein